MAIGNAYRANAGQVNAVSEREGERALTGPNATATGQESRPTKPTEVTSAPAQRPLAVDSFTPLADAYAQSRNLDITRLSMNERMTLEFSLAQNGGGQSFARSAADTILSPVDAVMGLFR